VTGDVDGALALFKEAAAKDTKEKSLSDELFAGLLSAQVRDDTTAMAYLEKVVSSHQPLPDDLMRKYVPGGSLTVPVTENLAVDVPFGSMAAALTLAELYQRNDRADEAIGLMQQLVEAEPDPNLVLSLCDLYAEVGAWDELVDVAAGITDEDNVSLQIRLYQARAFEEQGLKDAGLEAYKDALRSKKRDSDLLKEARYRRALLYLDTGKANQGHKELQKIYAEDPKYRDVAELLGT